HHEPKEIVMNATQYIRRFAATVAGLAGALLAFAAAAPAAFASGQPPPLPPLREKHPPLPLGHIHQPVHNIPAPVPVHTVVTGGMPAGRSPSLPSGPRYSQPQLQCSWTVRGPPTGRRS